MNNIKENKPNVFVEQKDFFFSFLRNNQNPLAKSSATQLYIHMRISNPPYGREGMRNL